MKLLYFAWLRSKIGTADEEVDLPGHVADVGGLIFDGSLRTQLDRLRVGLTRGR